MSARYDSGRVGWSGSVRFGSVRYNSGRVEWVWVGWSGFGSGGVVWFGSVRFGSVWCGVGLGRFGSGRVGLGRVGSGGVALVRVGSAWFGSVCIITYLSTGRPAMCHALVVTGSPSVVTSEKFWETGTFFSLHKLHHSLMQS